MRNFIVGILLILAGLIVPGYTIVNKIQFEQDCGGYLKQAADANTIEIAKTALSKAVSYIEEKGLTSGYTSIVYKTPDEDISFWYNNLRSSLNELLAAPDDISSLESSNMLLKLRETLTDDSQYGTQITVPYGISRHPSNTLICILNYISGLALFIGIVTILIEGHRRWDY